MRIRLAIAIGFVATASLWSQGRDYVKANYTKYEYQIRMRDGVKLFTAVYVPKEAGQRYPILLTRTPYSIGPYGVDQYPETLGPNALFGKDAFVFAYQDVRGRFMSEGEFVNARPQIPVKRGPKDVDESTDAYDTIDWLVKNVPNNGKVGMYGISYPGFYTATAMIDAHPALAAASPQAPIADWFVGDDFHHNGALYLPHALRFFAGNGRVFPKPAPKSPAALDIDAVDAYESFLKMPLSAVDELYFKGDVPFWKDLMEHGVYDQFWQSRNLRNHLKNIRPAVMTVGGWFDAEDLFGALEVYKTVERNNPGIYNVLVMGPWYHGGWQRADGDSLGNARFNQKTSTFFRENIELPFFKHFLKGTGGLSLPEAFVFETGRNEWQKFETWPPKNASVRSLYFHGGGKLSFDPPADPAENGSENFDEYVSDPAKPVPFVPYIASGMTREHMTDDQRFAATRPDVLVYQTEPLEGDVTLAGPVSPSLRVSTTGTDSDWVVKLIDVYPQDFPNPNPNPTGVRMAGYQQLVRGEVMRGKFRNSFEKPEPFVPGEVTRVEYAMPDVCHTFRRGHRIMVHVQSSWFPLVDRNPQKFTDIYKAKPQDFQKATQRVYRSQGSRSVVRVHVISAAAVMPPAASPKK